MTADARPAIVVDHAEIAQWVRDARATADDIERIVREGTEAILTTATKEAGQYSVTGQPAPIYVDLLDALGMSFAVLVQNADVLVRNLRADADFMEQAAANAAQIADDSAAAVTGVDPDVPGPTDRPTGKPGDPPGVSRAPVDPESMAVDKSGGDAFYTTPMRFDDIPKAVAPERL